MPAIIHITAPLPETQRNDHVYAGDIVVFRGFCAVAKLVEALRVHCRAHLGDDPERVHEGRTNAQVDRAAEALREAVGRDDGVAVYFNEALAAVGADLDATYGDGVVVRCQMAGGQSAARRLRPLPAHRDTWGSNVAAQTNWWAPLFPTTPERTIALFPAYFDKFVANDSAGWDFAELVRRLKSKCSEPDYPFLPTAAQAPPWTDALLISLVPGDLMCFSGAHLHASVPNTTRLSRLSFETRTVNGADVDAGRGAPNVDGRAMRRTYQLFKRLTDRQKLGGLSRN